MLQLRSTSDRGLTKLSWLDSRHTFSYADYYDPGYMGFSELRVINDNIVAPREGFGAQRHDNMEIVTIMLAGQMEHKDNMGNSTLLSLGEIQCMSTGTGIIHSEINPSLSKAAHFLQIWIVPNKLHLTPNYEKKKFSQLEMLNQLKLIVSETGESGSIHINQDVKIYQSIIDENKEITFDLKPIRQVWIQVIKGDVEANSLYLKNGDGLAVTEEDGRLKIKGLTDKSSVLLFDLPY